MNKLEELLNKLIEKGWKPFGEDCIKEVNYVKHHGTLCWYFWGGSYQRWKPIREILSKESGLWQFCVENGYNQYKKEYRMGYTKYNNKAEYWDEGDYEYYLIESALKDESELEEFLLNSIKID